MELTNDLLKAAVIGCSSAEAAKFLPAVNATLAKYNINTPLRVAHFLAQIGHESGGFDAVREYATGSAYEGRKDLGNVQKGDGVKFKGRGVIQITGRTNYGALSKALGVDFVANPVLLEQVPAAVLSAGWYWNSRNLNALADSNRFEAITRAINGGVNGYNDRLKRFKVAAVALGLTENGQPTEAKPAAGKSDTNKK